MELTRHRVVLRGDKAYSLDEYAAGGPVQVLALGTESSYGAHVLDVDLQDGWAGLAVVGYFDNGEDCTPSLLDSGVMQVPASASRKAGTHTITFTGSDAAGYRVSTKIPYRIFPKGCTRATDPPPSPDVFQQYVQQLTNALEGYFAGGTRSDVWTKLAGGKQGWQKPQAVGGASYSDLLDKPRINGAELRGDKTWQQLGFPDVQALADAAAQHARDAQDAAGRIPDPTGVPDAFLASNAEGTGYTLIPLRQIVQEVLAALPEGDEVSY